MAGSNTLGRSWATLGGMDDRAEVDLRTGTSEGRGRATETSARPRSFRAKNPSRLGSADPPPPPPPSDDERSIREQYAAAPAVAITHELVVEGDEAALLLDAYRANFDPLAELAVQAQSSGNAEMLAEFADPRIVKIVARERGIPVGLGMVTNQLEAVPDISPAFLRASFPAHAERDAIYLGMYVMVVPGHRGLTLFNRLYLEMWQLPAKVGGVLVFDVCEFNRTTFDTDVLAERIASSFPHSNITVIDRQTWYAAELPEPLPVRPP